MTFNILKRDGVLFAISVFGKDITEHKLAEEERIALLDRLNRSEKMEALGALAGKVAHDLNNVLGVLSGYSELLMESLPEGNALRKYAVNILKSSERGATIIQDLLTLARRGVTVSDVVDLNRIVSNLLVTPEFDRLKEYHPHVDIKTSLEHDLLNVKGSPVHLEKTLMNLVSNAAEAISRSGTVNIRTENRYLDKAVRGYDQVEEGDYVVLTVSDTGEGIAAADLDKIFEPFYTKKSMGRSGTGLGLAIVWGTVKDHEGYIDVQSIEGKGTTFTLYFPMTREAIGEEGKMIPVENYVGHGESILVVDDVESQRQVATDLLMQLGYKVNAVSSGEEAL
ncbi:MAG: ATP-binding protein, partial [Syntrophales bacterium LBB04]|nr:ATP-binding protein [Syntrophales bacterium LBB04]